MITPPAWLSPWAPPPLTPPVHTLAPRYTKPSAPAQRERRAHRRAIRAARRANRGRR